jgi:hypothetical protein
VLLVFVGWLVGFFLLRYNCFRALPASPNSLLDLFALLLFSFHSY